MMSQFETYTIYSWDEKQKKGLRCILLSLKTYTRYSWDEEQKNKKVFSVFVVVYE